MGRTAALVTAAGMSKRMGRFKPMMAIGDKTMAELVVEKFIALGVSTIVMVTGSRGDELETDLRSKGLRVIFVRNEDYGATDMFTSVRLGLKALEGRCDRLYFCPVDVPGFSLDTAEAIMRQCHGNVVMPECDGRIGHPIAIAGELVPSILSFSGERGLKGALDSLQAEKVFFRTVDRGCITDVDSYGDFLRLEQLMGGGKKRRIFMVRHGEIDAGQAKRYIGRTDLPLTARGEEEAASMGRYLSEMTSGTIWSSPLKRCRETARLIAEGSGGKLGPVRICADLSEIMLGDWEGQTFEQVKRSWPDLYRDRGRNLWETEVPGGESFCCAGNRFKSAVERIIRETEGDVIIVAHRGIIRAFLCAAGSTDAKRFMDIPQPPLGRTVLEAEGTGKYTLIEAGVRDMRLITDREMERLYKKYGTPAPVIAHMEKVAENALKVCDILDPGNTKYRRFVVDRAARLHDVLRHRKDHARAGAAILMREGYPEIAAMVREHHNGDIHTGSELTESDILFYADKITRGTDTVSVIDRFRSSQVKCVTAEGEKNHRKQFDRAMRIDKIVKEACYERDLQANCRGRQE